VSLGKGEAYDDVSMADAAKQTTVVVRVPQRGGNESDRTSLILFDAEMRAASHVLSQSPDRGGPSGLMG
jgi:hypothetical protein